MIDEIIENFDKVIHLKSRKGIFINCINHFHYFYYNFFLLFIKTETRKDDDTTITIIVSDSDENFKFKYENTLNPIIEYKFKIKYFIKYHKDITIFLDTLEYEYFDYITSPNQRSCEEFNENVTNKYVSLYKAGKRKLKIENIETILNNDL